MKDKFNGLLLFGSALVPGAGYMYMGLTRKGLEAMFLFFGCIAVASFVQMDELGALLAIPLWFYFFFDTYAVRRRLEEGIEVEDLGILDNFSDLVDDIEAKKYFYIGIALVVIGGIALLQHLTADLSAWVIFDRYVRQYLPSVVLIGIGAYMLFCYRRRTGKAE